DLGTSDLGFCFDLGDLRRLQGGFVSSWDKVHSAAIATILAIFSGVGLVISIVVHAVPPKRDVAIVWGLVVSVVIALTVGSMGDKAWLVVANMVALPLAWAYGIWRAIREAAIGKYDMDRSRWIGIALSVPAYGLIGSGAVPFALLAIVALEVADDPGPPHAEKRSAKIVDSGVFASVLQTKAFLQDQLQQCYVKLEAENIHAMLADLVRFEAVSSKLRAILGIKSAARRDFPLTSACLLEWYSSVRDGIVALSSGDNVFRVAGRTSLGIFDPTMNESGHYLLATWEIDGQGAITAYLHIIDFVEQTEGGLLAYLADVTPGSSGALLIHVTAGQMPTVIGANFAAMDGLAIGFALPFTERCLEKMSDCGYGVGLKSGVEEEVDAGLAAGVSRAAAVLPGAILGALNSEQTAAQRALEALSGRGAPGLTVQDDAPAGEKKGT
ncbi:unnamed protein product, partial [Effrenium voratum]